MHYAKATAFAALVLSNTATAGPMNSKRSAGYGMPQPYGMPSSSQPGRYVVSSGQPGYGQPNSNTNTYNQPKNSGGWNFPSIMNFPKFWGTPKTNNNNNVKQPGYTTTQPNYNTNNGGYNNNNGGYKPPTNPYAPSNPGYQTPDTTPKPPSNNDGYGNGGGGGSGGGGSSSSISSQVVEFHNKFRRNHEAPDLVWDEELANFAKNNMPSCSMQHTSNNKYGENLYLGYPSVEAGIQGWYDEVSKYNFESGGFSMSTGHFTQMVWKATTKVGCALNPTCNYMKCEYSSPGNVQGQYQQNVCRGKVDMTSKKAPGGYY